MVEMLEQNTEKDSKIMIVNNLHKVIEYLGEE